jgi:hypothetical protein
VSVTWLVSTEEAEDAADRRAALVSLYGPKVLAVPADGVIVEWEWPDGSGSWGWCVPGEVGAVVASYERQGCRVWLDGRDNA